MSPRKRLRVELKGKLAQADAPAKTSAAADQTEAITDDGPPEEDGHQAPHLRKQLFVRSLPPDVTNEAFTQFFSESYPLKHATVVVDPKTKACRGFGFVTFADTEDAQRARDEFDGAKFQGRKIKVEIAEPRHREIAGTISTDGAPSAVKEAAAEAKAQRQRHQNEAKQGQLPPKLIIRNLPWSIQEPEQLAVLFRSFGKVKHAVVPKKKPGLMSGFAFVVMRGRANAERALQAVNGKEVDGRTLSVDWAVDKEEWERTKQDSTAQEAVDEELSDADSGEYDEGKDRGDDSDLDDLGSPSDKDSDAASAEDAEDRSSTLFIRNLPFTATDDSLYQHFRGFGPVRYARVVMDHATDRSKGTGFVCFYDKTHADACVRSAPRPGSLAAPLKGRAVVTGVKQSVLEDELADSSGNYTLDGRVLQISRALGRGEAEKLSEEGSTHRNQRDRDKRRLFLLSEGTVSANSPLHQILPPSEISMREASTKQRKALLQNNPSLHLSLTRLSIRNIPRHVTSKDLKALAREAVVGFAKDVKMQKRQPLSKEEESRGGLEMREADKARRVRGKGIVRQAKIVFEGREGGKVSEESGAGRSRGYGFVEYSAHRWALMGLRWLNGHAIGPRPGEEKKKGMSREELTERKRRLVVEFAIENAQVVARRKEREEKARERSKTVGEKKTEDRQDTERKPAKAKARQQGMKRKRSDASSEHMKPGSRPGSKPLAGEALKTPGLAGGDGQSKERAASRQRMIGKKRMQRRLRKVGTGKQG